MSARQTQPLDSPVYAKVVTESPTKPVVGRCPDLGCFDDGEGFCTYCGGALFSEETKP